MKTPQKILRRFKSFDKEMRDIWESYELIQHMCSTEHLRVKSLHKNQPGSPVFERSTLYGAPKNLNAANAYGAISHLQRLLNPRHALLDAVAAFEEYIGCLLEIVLLGNPDLLKGDATTAEKEEIKLVNWIVESADKSEILERIVEERIRALFYGNPVDVLTKRKSKLRIHDYFSKPQCKQHIDKFAEIVARRNLIAHNDGHVDRKYLREVPSTAFTLGQKIPNDSAYIKDAIGFLLCLAGKASQLVLMKHYSLGVSRGVLASRLKCCKSLPAI